MISNYYAKRGGYKGPYCEYEKLILNHLRTGRVILDVGCGRSFPMASKWLSSGATVFGLDPVIDLEMLPPNVNAIKGSADQVDCADNMFDLIVSCAVLEHLENPKQVLLEFNRLLKPGGRAILLTPSKYDYVSIIAKLIPNSLHGRIVEATEGRDEEDTFPTFYRANSRKQIEKLSLETCFDLVKFQYLDQSPYSLKFNPILYNCGRFYHFMVRSVAPLNFLKGWVLCEISKPDKVK